MGMHIYTRFSRIFGQGVQWEGQLKVLLVLGSMGGAFFAISNKGVRLNGSLLIWATDLTFRDGRKGRGRNGLPC